MESGRNRERGHGQGIDFLSTLGVG